MAGRPRTRAKREAAAAAAAESPVSSSAGSRARAGTKAATTSKAKTPAKKKEPAKRQRGPARPRFEPATLADYDALAALEAKAMAKAEKEKPLTAKERVERDESIIAMWALGLTPPTISGRVGLTTRRVEQILDEHRRRRSGNPIPSSSELLHDMLDRVEALIDRTSQLADSATTWVGGKDGAEEKPNDAVRLGAVRTLLDLYTSQAGLWQAMGLVGNRPSDELRAERARHMLRRLLDELRALGVDQDQIDEAARRVLTPGADKSLVVLDGRASA